MEATDEELAPLEKHILSYWPQIRDEEDYLNRNQDHLRYMIQLRHYMCVPWKNRKLHVSKMYEKYEQLLRFTCCCFGYTPSENAILSVMEEILMERVEQRINENPELRGDLAALLDSARSDSDYITKIAQNIAPLLDNLPGWKEILGIGGLAAPKGLSLAGRLLKSPRAIIAAAPILTIAGGVLLYRKYTEYDRDFVVVSVLTYLKMRKKIDARLA